VEEAATCHFWLRQEATTRPLVALEAALEDGLNSEEATEGSPTMVRGDKEAELRCKPVKAGAV